MRNAACCLTNNLAKSSFMISRVILDGEIVVTNDLKVYFKVWIKTA